MGFSVLGLDFSPIKGPEGNIEFLLYLQKDSSRDEELEACTEADVEDRLEEETAAKTGYGFEEEVQKMIGSIVEKAHLAL